MKILGICGSMRKKSNSEWMLRKVLESAQKEKAETEIVLLRTLNIKYCNGCDVCAQNGGKCVINDDMQEIYFKLRNANVIIVSSPNYFKNVTALMKNFIDRTNAFVRVKPRKMKNKYAIGLCVGGEELEDTQHCEDALVRFFEGHRMKILSMVKAKADKPGSINENTELEKKLVFLGRRIASDKIDGMDTFR